MDEELREKLGKVAYEAHVKWLHIPDPSPWQELSESAREGCMVQVEAVVTAFVDELHPVANVALISEYFGLAIEPENQASHVNAWLQGMMQPWTRPTRPETFDWPFPYPHYYRDGTQE